MITLIGHGYVGQAIAAELARQQIEFAWQHHDWVNPVGTAIINAAGFTGTPNVDECERRKKETIAGSIVFPLDLERHGIPVVHITSGCVYNGYTEGGWTEEDRPNFDFVTGSFYSGVKALEQEILDKGRNYLLRIRLPFGREEHPKNYLTKLARYPKLIDVRNSLSCVEDVAATAAFFATELPDPGIYNVCNSDDVTTKEVAMMLGIEKPWFTEAEFRDAVLAPRSNCTLNTDKLAKIFTVRPVRVALWEAIG